MNTDKITKIIIGIMAIITILVVLLLFTTPLLASDYKYRDITRITEVTNVTELTNITEVINKYYVNDQCQGVAIAQAGANNQMYLGTHKPQLSLGIGECGGEVAGSLMFGVKPCKNCPLVNGSIAVDDDVDAYGVGATWIFK